MVTDLVGELNSEVAEAEPELVVGDIAVLVLVELAEDLGHVLGLGLDLVAHLIQTIRTLETMHA